MKKNQSFISIGETYRVEKKIVMEKKEVGAEVRKVPEQKALDVPEAECMASSKESL